MIDNDFVKLGNGLADSLLAAAEEQVTKAHTIHDQTKALVEIIRNQVTAQSKQIEDTNARFRSFGEIMLNAHRVLIGEAPDTREAPVSNLARRSAAISALAAIKPAPGSAADANSELGASHPAGQRQLPRTVGGVSQHDPRNDHGENRADPTDATSRAYWGADRN